MNLKNFSELVINIENMIILFKYILCDWLRFPCDYSYTNDAVGEVKCLFLYILCINDITICLVGIH